MDNTTLVSDKLLSKMIEKPTFALAHLNSAEESMLDLPWWKRILLGKDYDEILQDGIQMAQQYLKD